VKRKSISSINFQYLFALEKIEKELTDISCSNHLSLTCCSMPVSSHTICAFAAAVAAAAASIFKWMAKTHQMEKQEISIRQQRISMYVVATLL